MTNPLTKPACRRVLKVTLVISAVIALALGLVAAGYGWLYYRGQQSLHTSANISTPSNLVDASDGDRVIYQGKTYKYNDNITSVLVMGVDKKDIQSNGKYGENGQADCLFLLALDVHTGATHIIPISREVMVDVNKYAVDGTYTGVKKTQLCLAYAYAATGEEACLNVARSVSRLLYGVTVDKYVAIDLEGLSVLTDAIGGVPLSSLEDMALDSITVKQGQTVTLTGDQAIHYIQWRGQDTHANNRRMARQKQFFTSFIGQTGQLLQSNAARLPALYNAAEPYTVSNMTLSELTYLASNTLSKGGWHSPRYHNITGETVMGEKYVEFYADSTSVYEAVLATFYIEVE